MNEKIKNYYYDRRTIGLSDEQIARNLGMDPEKLKSIINENVENDVPAEILNTFESVQEAKEEPTNIVVETETVADETPTEPEIEDIPEPKTVEKVKKPAWSDPES